MSSVWLSPLRWCPLTNALGPNGVADQAAYIKFAVVIGALSMIFLLLLYKTSKETAAQEKSPMTVLAFGDAINKLFHNKYWVIVLLANLLVNVIYALSSSSGTYYAKYILGNDNLIGIMGAVGLIPTFVGFIVVGPMTKKFGLTKTLKIAFALGIIGNVIRASSRTALSFASPWVCWAARHHPHDVPGRNAEQHGDGLQRLQVSQQDHRYVRLRLQLRR